MNPFDEIETYITTQVQSVDSNLEFFPDPFGEEDINNIIANRKFKFYFTTTELLRSGTERIENINAVLEIYGKRTREQNQSFKDLYCKALDIKNAITDPLESTVNQTFSDVLATLAEPLPLDTDDNTIKIVLNLTIRRDITF